MKKTLVSALTTALVVGAASTTFAAANPFSDVPADHWAYDAVTQLAADGVIEGYGDTTFQGDKSITRYEMAQMVAKAMAKTDVSATDKAMIDKLAAEFADELGSLGVRVSNLEKHADMVKWNGELRYRYWSTREEGEHRANKDQLRFRLKPTAEVNDHWDVHAQIDSDMDISKDTTATAKLKEAYAQGHYKNFGTKLGRFALWSEADQGLLLDDDYSGAQVTFGKDLKVTLEAGRWSGITSDTDAAANMQAIDLSGTTGKLRGGVAYHHFNSDAFKSGYTQYQDNGTTDEANIWSVGAGYNFDGNWDLFGAFAKNASADNYSTSHNIQLTYKGSDKVNQGTWGAYAAYRYVSSNVSLCPTYDTATSGFLNAAGSKGWEVGADYTPFHNVYTAVSYFDGKHLAADQDVKVLFGRVSFFF
ncbi:S-layer homology domain-containing protein [uncultured Selenomonas sp.]|uniref:S-layer homology domain-containing protein n=1 Tax=uncultured Selenomonas sp. TaxID=159275 RepID=UPI0025F61272|nr:S-layer homology domain-containing protein [uncultured Selenomonas sp.]